MALVGDPTFAFHKLPVELKLKVLEFVKPPTLMGLLRADRETNDLINRYRLSITRGIIEQQYPDAFDIITWSCRRLEAGDDEDDEDEVPPKMQLYEACQAFIMVTELYDREPFSDAALDLEEDSPSVKRIKAVGASRWGLIKLVDEIETSVDHKISKLANKVIFRGPHYETNSVWAFFERDKSAPKPSSQFPRLLKVQMYSMPDVRRALYLFWKLQWLFHSVESRVEDRYICLVDRIEYMTGSSPKTRKILRLLIEEIVYEFSLLPECRVITREYDPSRSDDDALSPAARSRMKHRELVIRREQEYTIIINLIFQGTNFLDALDEGLETMTAGNPIPRWLADDSKCTPEQSQAEWVGRDLVALEVLSEDPDVRLTIGKQEWEAIEEDPWEDP
ncbi:hypothetical protein MMC14_006597 [Varicellaria rhodocarpa]|nr:hypothetical protein [Varicellaria rhodocarpa]